MLYDLKFGENIAASDPCLIATASGKDRFTAWAMPENLQKTYLQHLTFGSKVNLKWTMALNEHLGGHRVSGHIDTVVTLAEKNLRATGS